MDTLIELLGWVLGLLGLTAIGMVLGSLGYDLALRFLQRKRVSKATCAHCLKRFRFREEDGCTHDYRWGTDYCPACSQALEIFSRGRDWPERPDSTGNSFRDAMRNNHGIHTNQ